MSVPVSVRGNMNTMATLSNVLALTVLQAVVSAALGAVFETNIFAKDCGTNICDERKEYCDTVDNVCEQNCENVCAHQDKEACDKLCKCAQCYENGKLEQKIIFENAQTSSGSIFPAITPNEQKQLEPADCSSHTIIIAVISCAGIISILLLGGVIIYLLKKNAHYKLVPVRDNEEDNQHASHYRAENRTSPGTQQSRTTNGGSGMAGANGAPHQVEDSLSYTQEIPDNSMIISDPVEETTEHTPNNSQLTTSPTRTTLEPSPRDSLSPDTTTDSVSVLQLSPPPPYSALHSDNAQTVNQEGCNTLPKEVPMWQVAKFPLDSASSSSHGAPSHTGKPTDTTSSGQSSGDLLISGHSVAYKSSPK